MSRCSFGRGMYVTLPHLSGCQIVFHSKHRIQHRATPSSMVDHGATPDHPLYWLPKKPRPLHILQLQRVSLPPALHCQQLRKFQTCYVWFSQMYRKTSQLATSVGMEIMWRLIGSRTLQIQKPIFSHLLRGIRSMWIFRMTLWCMDQAVNGWFDGQGHWQFGTPPKRWWSAAKWRWRSLKEVYHVHHNPCGSLGGGISLVLFDTLISIIPSIQTWNLLMDER